jgi:sec-independent protein translocase protein TatC
MFSEIKGLMDSIAKWFVAMLFIAVFLFAFNVRFFSFGNFVVPVPWAGDESFAVQFFSMMRSDLVPPEVDLIVTSPLDAFLIEMKVAIFLTFIFTFPFLLGSMLQYLTPALKKHEKTAVYKVLIPACFLFIGGCIFAYILVVPATIRILYSFTPDIHATAFFGVDGFISLTFSLMIIIGFMFLLPVFMVLSSYVGVIPYELWRKYFRQAIFAFILITAIITPDGSGITMLMLSIPLFLLYIIGLLLSRRYRIITHELAKNLEESVDLSS